VSLSMFDRAAPAAAFAGHEAIANLTSAIPANDPVHACQLLAPQRPRAHCRICRRRRLRDRSRRRTCAARVCQHAYRDNGSSQPRGCSPASAPGRAHRDGAHESHWLVGSPYQGRRLHPAAKGSTAWRCATTCPTARSSLTAQLITSSTPPQVRQLRPPSAAATPPGRRRYRRRPRTTSRGQPPIASPVAAGQVLPPAASFSWACSRSPACQYWRKRVAEKQEEGGSHQTG